MQQAEFEVELDEQMLEEQQADESLPIEKTVSAKKTPVKPKSVGKKT